MAKPVERRDQCCLCGKVKEQVEKLIVGLNGAVCTSCIDLCNDILHNAATAKFVPPLPGAEWDGSVIIDKRDRVVFDGPAAVRHVVSQYAESVRSYVHSGDADDSNEG